MKSSKRICRVLGAAAAVAVSCFTLRGHAGGTTASYEVLEEASAGAAEVVEAGIEPTEEEIRQKIEENAANAWKEPGSLVMANVMQSVNVREEPSENSALLGLLYKDCGGYILEYTDEWTLMQSGELTGWVKNDYLFFGQAAEATLDEVGVYQAKVTTDMLNVRKEPSVDSLAAGVVDEGDVFEVIEDGDEWVKINYEGQPGYLNKQYLDVGLHMDYGETLAAIAVREEEERRLKREAERFKYYGVYAATASDVELLGALIWCESGNQPFEGMVAVGAVVMNRLRSPAYPNTLQGVIYASGQFTPAGSGAVDRRIANGVPATCLQAAQQALDGFSNVGDATHFRAVGRHEGIEIGGHVFW